MTDAGRIPGPIVIPNCVQLRIVWTLPGPKTIYNVLHGRVAPGFTPTSVIAEAIFAALKASAGWTAWKTHVCASVSLAGVDLRDLRTANQPIVASTGAAVPGTGAGSMLSPRSALVVTERSAFVGQANRGRAYLGGIDTVSVTNAGIVTAATQTDAAAFITALQTAMTGQAMTLCLGQPARAAYTGHGGRQIPARAAQTVDVTSIVCRNTTLDSQRRRALRS